MRFQTIFKYRRNMMAAAIMLVLVYHVRGALPESALKKIAGYFYGGVDIFFFASGIGCFFSWNRERDPVSFLSRRAGRILPVYLPFILVWLALAARAEGMSAAAALANLFGVHGFTAVTPSFNWYVSGMWLSYLLTPWLSALAAKADTRSRALAALLALVILSAAFWGDTQLVIIMARLPIFLAGMLFAAESGRREALTKPELCALVGLVPVGAALLLALLRLFPDQGWDRALAWYPFLLITPGLCALTAWTAEGLSRFRAGRAVNRALELLGGVTFEIYLAHFFALELPLPLFLPVTALCAAALWGAGRLLRLGGKHLRAR